MSARLMARRAEPHPRPEGVVRCRTCGVVLGVSAGGLLTVGAVGIRESVCLVCACCRTPRVWRPGKTA